MAYLRHYSDHEGGADEVGGCYESSYRHGSVKMEKNILGDRLDIRQVSRGLVDF